MDNQKLSARLSALAEKIDAFLESYLREGELFGPPVWLIPPPWYAFKYRKIDRETNRRLHAHGLPEMTMDFRLRFNTQAGQGLEDCGGYLRRKWFVALGVDHAEYDAWAYAPISALQEKDL